MILDILLSQFWTSLLFHVQFYCCFLTFIQVSQEAGKIAWYSHLFKNFPQFSVIHTVKGFSIVNEADVFLQLSCFSMIQWDVGNLISGSPAFYKSSLYIWKFCYNMLSHGILSTTLWGHLQYAAGLRDVSDSPTVTQRDHPNSSAGLIVLHDLGTLSSHSPLLPAALA